MGSGWKIDVQHFLASVYAVMVELYTILEEVIYASFLSKKEH